jgi:CheY-like chemotaxis protein
LATRWWLLVENDEGDRITVQRAVQQLGRGIQVEWNPSGVGVAEQLRARIEAGSPPPELILLDLDLTDTTGHDVLVGLKQDARTRPIPVVMHSSSERRDDVARAFELGAAGYFLKRLEFDRVVGELRAIADYWEHSLHALG